MGVGGGEVEENKVYRVDRGDGVEVNKVNRVDRGGGFGEVLLHAINRPRSGWTRPIARCIAGRERYTNHGFRYRPGG